MLPPGERRRAEAINVLSPGNAGGGNRGSVVTGERRTGRTPQGKCCHRGNLAGRKPSCYYRGNAIGGNKENVATGAKATGECYHRGNVVGRKL